MATARGDLERVLPRHWDLTCPATLSVDRSHGRRAPHHHRTLSEPALHDPGCCLVSYRVRVGPFSDLKSLQARASASRRTT